ncbi:MAG TPA: STAS domain-containing protein [Acidobacteriaceae bacterium]|nr:STAS domain-containing protein [Acidobacteriaceae bacterium]
MSTTSQPQVSQPPFSIERHQGKSPSTVIFRLSGPFTARKMYGHLTPDELQKVLAFQSIPGEQLPARNILDLSEVPYMDSLGLGMIVTHYVSSTNKGIKTIAAGPTPRVLELFQLTKVDSIIPIVATVAGAEEM